MEEFKINYEAGGTYVERGKFSIKAESKEVAIQKAQEMRDNGDLGKLRMDYEEADYEIY